MTEWDVQDWFGAGGVVAILAAAMVSVWSSYVTAQRTGRQKIAEARLAWSNRYKDLSLELDYLIAELTRLQQPTRLRSFRAIRLGMEAKKMATEMLFMTNPESDDDAAQDEYAMEIDLLSRLSRIGITLDMDYVRRHRKVLKHNWRRAKAEF